MWPFFPLKRTIDAWGLYLWYPDDGLQLVHPDDRDELIRFGPSGHVFQCVADLDMFVVLEYGERRFRVRPARFQPVRTPSHRIGERVLVLRKEGLKEATICDMLWHFKRRCVYYLVVVDGKRSGMWYFDQDIKPPGN